MPTYEYLCQACGQQFEVFQSFKDKALQKHPDCGGDVRKVFHASGVVFKGSGFYVTDSRGKAKSSSSSDSSGSSGSSGSSDSSDSSDSSSSSDSKPKKSEKVTPAAKSTSSSSSSSSSSPGD